MKRKVGGLIAALVLAAIGTALLVSYVQSAKDEAVSGETLVDVLVVEEAILRGTTAAAAADRVKVEQVPAKVRAEDAFTSVDELEDLEDRVAAIDLVPSEQVLASRFVSPDAVRAANVPPGFLEVTVSLEPQRVVGGRIRPGSTVAILQTFSGSDSGSGGGLPDTTSLLLHKVLVTAVQADNSEDSAFEAREGDEPRVEDAPSGSLLVTFALEARDVERVVFGAEFGSLWLAIEPPDAPDTPGSQITRDNVFG